jgi:hypothetical protein
VTINGGRAAIAAEVWRMLTNIILVAPGIGISLVPAFRRSSSGARPPRASPVSISISARGGVG